jgi:hypothetical protein
MSSVASCIVKSQDISYVKKIMSTLQPENT